MALPNSVRRYTCPDEDIDVVIDVRAVFQQVHRGLAIEFMPSLLLPRKGRYGLHDYEKMFCADGACGQDIFTMRAVDREAGCMVIVRPICRAGASARRARSAGVLFRRLHAAATAGQPRPASRMRPPDAWRRQLSRRHSRAVRTLSMRFPAFCRCIRRDRSDGRRVPFSCLRTCGQQAI
jgi:hypothetical protein